MLITVIQSVYLNDKVESVKRSVYSILCQKFKSGINLEYIVVIDGAVEQDVATFLSSVQSKTDMVIKIVKREQNSGLAAAMNTALNHANGQFIFRMDSDDTCDETRLSKQVDFMLKYNLDVCGTSISYILGEQTWTSLKPCRFSSNPENFPSKMPFNHASVGFRASYLSKHAIRYDERFRGHLAFEDLILWRDIFLSGGKFGNLREPLYTVIQDTDLTARRSNIKRTWNLFLWKYRVARDLGLPRFKSLLLSFSALNRTAAKFLPSQLVLFIRRLIDR